ncbi:MAG: ribonuclease P protein component [Candidatus Levybacteria bacterium]|nr:ribonuclease P protein component [Candidatus Levybacteria bacterium]
MFKKENRLVKGLRFKSSRPISVPELIIRERKNDLLLNRFGVVVSKKIDKRAVGRNKVKRMLRDILLDLNKNMIVGHDILVVARVGIKGKTKKEAYPTIETIMKNLGLIKE